MARVQCADAIYGIAEQFRNRCLAASESLLWPGQNAWAERNISELWDAFIGNPDESNRPFLDKWHDQLAGCSQAVHMIAADVFALYHLGVWQGAIGADKKLKNVRTVIGWKLGHREPDLALIRQAFSVGLAHPGQYYLHSGRPWQIAFYLEFTRQFHKRSMGPPDLAGCRALADEVNADLTQKLGHTSFARHFLLHLLFPAHFESIVSTAHKTKIAKRWAPSAGGAEDTDEQIYNIRRELEKSYGEGFDFYSPKIRPLWDNGEEDRKPGIGPDSILAGIADLLEDRQLDEPGILTGESWKQNIRPVTRPFLTKVSANLQGVSTGFSEKSGAGKKRSDFDRLHVLLSDNSVPWGYGGPHAIVTVGYVDLPERNPNLERCLVWGIDGWMPESAIDDAAERARQFLGPDFTVRVEDASETSHWSGKYVVGFKALDPEALRRRQSDELATEIAADLSQIIERVRRRSIDGGGDKPTHGLTALSAATFLPVAELTELKLLLEDKKQVILEGPPGAGKTYVAEKFARYFTENPLDGKLSNGRLEIVQFHQSYGYEDFVQGIRPETDGVQISYEVKPGIFGRFCEEARRDPDGRPHVIIIDEINRGNVARIFGELLLALEYRDKEVRLPYADEHEPKFTIPDNVYVIGTMNTTDRSLALLDYALRRRFYFYRLMPVRDGDAPVLRGWLQKHAIGGGDRLLRLFIKLNEEVQTALGPQGMHFQVGHSYFMNNKIGDAMVLERIWKRAILPLLEEYFYPAKNTTQLAEEFSIERLLRPVVSAPEITAEAPDMS